MAKTVATLRRLADLRPDPHNANRGTERGLGFLDRSLERTGIGRSVLADKHGVLIAGNKTVERIGDLTGGDVEIIVVKTTGRQLVVVQREDLDLASATDARARELAIADNRTSEVSLAWDPEVLLNHLPGVDLQGYFLDQELARMFGEADAKGELTTAQTQRPAAAEPTVEPSEDQRAPVDAADENQTICPECGAQF